MDTMKYISRTGRQLSTSLQGQFSNLLWCLVGVFLAPIFVGLATLFLKIPDKILSVLLLILCLLLLILSLFSICLLGKYDQAKRFINEHHPNIDLDGLEKEAEGFNDETDDDEIP